ncbi:MAG: NTP transferase domain-containing protein [Clostridia bacterium]|nr:NTP transferase domain-containing protein [Clostridia bacterium]
MLSKKQFDVLDLLIEDTGAHTQRDIALKVGISVGAVNKTLNELNELGFTDGNTVTSKGYEIMENYRVKRAVIIAAGFGSRLVPITLNTPKPLVRVKGNRIIDSTLTALKEAGIEEIYLVRGYLAEQFDQLLYKFPNIKFIENPLYNETNNISSVLCAGDKVCGAYILEADLLLSNKSLIKKYQYQSNYLGIPVEKSDDWCFYTEDKIVKKMSIGGVNCHQMVGISYWTEEDGKKLVEDVKKVFFMPGGKERYWDQVPLEYCLSNYKVAVRECDFKDIVEIDTYSELKAIDESYR